MKNKMIALWISMGVLACLISFFLGKHYSLFTPESVSDTEMQSFMAQMKPLLANDEARTNDHLSLLIEVLKALDAGEDTRAKKEIIDRLGRFYYNYTYENERNMNSEATESLLKSMESLGATSKSFSSVLKFRPEE